MTVSELINILEALPSAMKVTAERGDYGGYGIVGRPVLFITDENVLHIQTEDDEYPNHGVCEEYVKRWVVK